jgi:hypothetical protein
MWDLLTWWQLNLRTITTKLSTETIDGEQYIVSTRGKFRERPCITKWALHYHKMKVKYHLKQSILWPILLHEMPAKITNGGKATTEL